MNNKEYRSKSQINLKQPEPNQNQESIQKNINSKYIERKIKF